MGIFRTDIELENPARPDERRVVPSVMVDTGSELSWFPAPVLESLGIRRLAVRRFRQATGTIVERWIGSAMLYVGDACAPDFMVFAEPGDLTLLGSRSLEGLNLIVDPVNRRLLDAGPMPAAVAA